MSECIIELAGNPQFPRYRLVDCDAGAWTGHHWSYEYDEACLYYRYDDAVRDLRAITLRECAKEQHKIYTATITVDVIGKQPRKIKQLSKYLSDTARLWLDGFYPKRAIVLLQADWDSLKEVEDVDENKQQEGE